MVAGGPAGRSRAVLLAWILLGALVAAALGLEARLWLARRAESREREREADAIRREADAFGREADAFGREADALKREADALGRENDRSEDATKPGAK